MGFEPTVPLRGHLLSREAQSTVLCHLSTEGRIPRGSQSVASRLWGGSLPSDKMPVMKKTATSGEIYAAMRRELVALARGLSTAEAALAVPHSPAWSISDVVAHVVGISLDLIEGNLDGLGSDAWTEAQVSSRADRSLEEVCVEWEQMDDRIDVFMANDPFFAVRAGADLVTHVHDVLGALGRSDQGLEVSGRDGPGVRMALERYGPSFCERAAAAGLGVVRVDAGEQVWQSGDGVPVIELRGSAFELLRAFSGRRSVAQVRSMDWSGDPTPYVPVVSPYGMPDSDIGG